ncbi:MAG: major coat protein [Candidatus Pseudoruminococcus sp.]|nr:hypothetical protein [Ruminococcus sp.]MDY2783285.1 major coat protein [Candidatus Pseudoruminococcus sp.]
MGKIKAFVNRHKSALAVSAVSASLMVSSALSAFAAEGDTTVQSQFDSGIKSIQGDLMSYLGYTIPVAIAVIGAFFGIRKAVSFFLKLTRKD